VKGDLRGILRARRLSRATLRNIRQNLLGLRLQRARRALAGGVLYPAFGLATLADDRQRGDESEQRFGDRKRPTAPACRRLASLPSRIGQ